MISCTSNSDCPPLNSCALLSGRLQCQHDPLFPVPALGWVGYILLPVGLSFANAAGVSGGFLKVLVLMDILNYTANEATYLSYPTVFGGGLVNFLLLIFKRNSHNDTLVDYILVLILLPTQVYGVTIGNIITNVVPAIGNDIATIVVFIIIAVIYTVRLVRAQLKRREDAKLADLQLAEMPILELAPVRESQMATGDRDLVVHYRESVLSRGSAAVPTRLSEAGEDIRSKFVDLPGESDPNQQPKQQLPSKVYVEGVSFQCVKRLLLKYKADYILLCVVIFTVFQTLSLLVQGKLVEFTPCNPAYGVGIALLGVGLAVYLFFLRRFIPRLIRGEQTRLERLCIKYVPREYDILQTKTFLVAMVSALIGGFLNGFLGAGVGSCIVLGLLVVGVASPTASASSGFQIVFTGASSLIQAFANEEITLDQFEWYFLLSLIGSVIGSLLLYFVVDRFELKRMREIILVAINFLISFGEIPAIIVAAKYYGWGYLTHVSGFKC